MKRFLPVILATSMLLLTACNSATGSMSSETNVTSTTESTTETTITTTTEETTQRVAKINATYEEVEKALLSVLPKEYVMMSNGVVPNNDEMIPAWVEDEFEFGDGYTQYEYAPLNSESIIDIEKYISFVIFEFKFDSTTLKKLSVGDKFKTIRTFPDNNEKIEFEFTVSAINGQYVLCLIEKNSNSLAPYNLDAAKALYDEFMKMK